MTPKEKPLTSTSSYASVPTKRTAPSKIGVQSSGWLERKVSKRKKLFAALIELPQPIPVQFLATSHTGGAVSLITMGTACATEANPAQIPSTSKLVFTVVIFSASSWSREGAAYEPTLPRI